MTSSAPIKHESISHEAILQWLAEFRAAARDSALAEPLEFDGVDTVDVIMSPLFLAVLNAIRNAGRTPRPANRLADQFRFGAFRLRLAAQQRLAAWRSAPVRPVDVLLWTREITHSAVLEPVARALSAENASCAFLTCQSKTYHQLRQRNVQSTYAPAAWPERLREARADALRRAARLADCRVWPLPRFEDVPPQLLEQTVRATVEVQLPFVAEALANARAALDAFCCRVLVVGNDLTIEGRAGCRVAAARGIPTAVFMHGNITGNALQALHCADRLLVFGDAHRQTLQQRGIADERMVVCGSPNLDALKKQSGHTHPDIAARFGIGPGDPWILVATSGSGNSISQRHHEIVIANLARLSQSLPGVPVIVRLHRKDRAEFYRQALKDCAGSRFFVLANKTRGLPGDIFEWLQGCSVVLTGASTVAVEAMLLDVPVITMDFCNEIGFMDFIQAGATLHVRSYDELERGVRHIVAEGCPAKVRPHVQNYVESFYLALDGCSAQRGARVLRGLAGLP